MGIVKYLRYFDNQHKETITEKNEGFRKGHRRSKKAYEDQPV